MTTARDSIYAAFRLLRITPDGETPTDSEATDGLASMNKMMHGWKGRGADIGHNDLALSDDHIMGAEYHEAIEYLLAARLAAEYARPVTSAVATVANKGWNAIWAAYAEPANLTFEAGLPGLSGEGRYDINTG